MLMPKLKLLLDENIGQIVTKKLRADNYDVISVLEDYRGQADEIILKLAHKSKRLFITLVKDFGALVHLHSRKHAGVLLLRLENNSPENIYKILNPILKRSSNLLKANLQSLRKPKSG